MTRSSRPHVVVVGSINLDLVTAVERHPLPGETLLARSVARNAGGKGGNQAVAAARAGGAWTSMVGWLGTDPEGDALQAGLEADGIDVSGLERVEGPSGLALITVDAAGENSIIVVSGANTARAGLSEQQLAVVASGDVVLAQLETPVEVVRQAAAARRPGAVFVLNAAPAQSLPASLLELVDVLVVNEHEARVVAGMDDPWEAARSLAGEHTSVLLTLGAAGSALVQPDGSVIEQPARRVTAVDTTAAGDTFCGVFCAEIGGGSSWGEALHRASEAAAITVTRPGAQPSIPAAADF